MKFEVSVTTAAFKVDDGNDKGLWIVEIDSPDAAVIYQAVRETVGEAFEAALLKLTFDRAGDNE